MGQQQLLLIVLGVIIVGIAVVVGINTFSASSSQANTDALIADLSTIAANAQQFYRKPQAMGGGGNSFNANNNYAIPTTLQQTANMSAPVALTLGDQSITLVATGTEEGTKGAGKAQVTMIVGPNAITSTVIDN